MENLSLFNEELRDRVLEAKEAGIAYKFLTLRTGFGCSTIKQWIRGNFNLTAEKALILHELLEKLEF